MKFLGKKLYWKVFFGKILSRSQTLNCFQRFFSRSLRLDLERNQNFKSAARHLERFWATELKSLVPLSKNSSSLETAFRHSFCSTSLPLASTRWVQSTIKLCTVHSLSSVLSLNVGNIKLIFLGIFLGGIEPGAAGWEARTLPLCYGFSSLKTDTHFVSPK